jgi:sec-independent protein translocase protein TatB
MFGIGMPEMILILALALIVVGPDKLPDLARSMAKGLMELKKTAEGLKASFDEEGTPLNEIREDLEDASKSLKNNLLDMPPAENAKMAYAELLKRTSGTHASAPDAADTAAEPDVADTAAEPDVAENTPVPQPPLPPQKPNDQ